MSCERWQEEIEERVGAGPLSAELSAHLDGCLDCRRQFQELTHALDALSVDDPFTKQGIVENFDSFEADRFLAGVNDRIDLLPLRKISIQIWPKFLAAAVVVFLVIGSLVTVYMYSPNDSSVTSAGFSEQDLIENLWDEGENRFDDGSIEVILSKIAPGNQYGLEEAIIEGLNDDDMEYLELNFQVGDLL